MESVIRGEQEKQDKIHEAEWKAEKDICIAKPGNFFKDFVFIQSCAVLYWD